MRIIDTDGVFYVDSEGEVQHLPGGSEISTQILQFFTKGQLERLSKNGRIELGVNEKSLTTLNDKKMPESGNKSTDKDNQKNKKASGLEG